MLFVYKLSRIYSEINKRSRDTIITLDLVPYCFSSNTSFVDSTPWLACLGLSNKAMTNFPSARVRQMKQGRSFHSFSLKLWTKEDK